jgi:hypothetical protein
MKCDFCGVQFTKGPVKKTIRGKKYTFCSEYCYVLHHFRIPKFPVDRSYGPLNNQVLAPPLHEICRK